MRPSGLTDPRGPLFPDRVGHGYKPGSPEWLGWIGECDLKVGHLICGRVNRFDEPCMRRSPEDSTIQGSMVDYGGRPPCHIHGGASHTGVAHPAYTHGRTSRYSMRGNLARYRDRLEDLDYLSLREDMAMVEELTEQALAVLDDDTPCPEPWSEPPLDPKAHGEEAAKARDREIRARELEIRDWQRARAAATERYDKLVDAKTKLARTEIARVKQAQDTLHGGAVRLFGQTVLDVVRRRLMAFSRKHGIPTEDVLSEMADIQEEVVNAVANSRGTSG